MRQSPSRSGKSQMGRDRSTKFGRFDRRADAARPGCRACAPHFGQTKSGKNGRYRVDFVQKRIDSCQDSVVFTAIQPPGCILGGRQTRPAGLWRPWKMRAKNTHKIRAQAAAALFLRLRTVSREIKQEQNKRAKSPWAREKCSFTSPQIAPPRLRKSLTSGFRPCVALKKRSASRRSGPSPGLRRRPRHPARRRRHRRRDCG